MMPRPGAPTRARSATRTVAFARRLGAGIGVALALTGLASARWGEAPVRPAVLRNMAGGLLAMGITYAIGTVAGTGLG